MPQFPLLKFMVLFSACYRHRMPFSPFFSFVLFLIRSLLPQVFIFMHIKNEKSEYVYYFR